MYEHHSALLATIALPRQTHARQCSAKLRTVGLTEASGYGVYMTNILFREEVFFSFFKKAVIFFLLFWKLHQPQTNMRCFLHQHHEEPRCSPYLVQSLFSPHNSDRAHRDSGTAEFSSGKHWSKKRKQHYFVIPLMGTYCF